MAQGRKPSSPPAPADGGQTAGARRSGPMSFAAGAASQPPSAMSRYEPSGWSRLFAARDPFLVTEWRAGAVEVAGAKCSRPREVALGR